MLYICVGGGGACVRACVRVCACVCDLIYIYSLSYSSACGDQLIRFSCATNMSRTQESGYMQVTYKKRKHVNIPFDSSQQTMCGWGSMAIYYIHMKTILTPQFTFNSNFLWSKRNLSIEHFDTTDSDFSFILGSNN